MQKIFVVASAAVPPPAGKCRETAVVQCCSQTTAAGRDLDGLEAGPWLHLVSSCPSSPRCPGTHPLLSRARSPQPGPGPRPHLASQTLHTGPPSSDCHSRLETSPTLDPSLCSSLGHRLSDLNDFIENDRKWPVHFKVKFGNYLETGWIETRSDANVSAVKWLIGWNIFTSRVTFVTEKCMFQSCLRLRCNVNDNA